MKANSSFFWFFFFHLLNYTIYIVSLQPQSSRSISPRRLTKQVALESPPPIMQPDPEENHSFYRSVHDRKASAAVGKLNRLE